MALIFFIFPCIFSASTCKYIYIYIYCNRWEFLFVTSSTCAMGSIFLYNPFLLLGSLHPCFNFNLVENIIVKKNIAHIIAPQINAKVFFLNMDCGKKKIWRPFLCAMIKFWAWAYNHKVASEFSILWTKWGFLLLLSKYI
jgi:hypothetical protein